MRARAQRCRRSGTAAATDFRAHVGTFPVLVERLAEWRSHANASARPAAYLLPSAAFALPRRRPHHSLPSCWLFSSTSFCAYGVAFCVWRALRTAARRRPQPRLTYTRSLGRLVSWLGTRTARICRRTLGTQQCVHRSPVALRRDEASPAAAAARCRCLAQEPYTQQLQHAALAQEPYTHSRHAAVEKRPRTCPTSSIAGGP